MFENISAEESMSSLLSIISLAKSRGYVSIVVPLAKFRPDGSRLCAFLSSNAYVTLKHCQTVSLDMLPRFARLFFATSNAQVGPLVMHQGGIPIGGIPSSAFANLVLSTRENSWICDGPRRSQAGFPDIPWNVVVASSRYVDDLQQSSTSICNNCILFTFKLIYDELVWEHTSIAPNVWSRWLDVELLVDGFNLSLRPTVPSSDLAEKCRIPPFLHADCTDVAMLCSLLRGRISRLQQLPITRRQITYALIFEVCVLLSRNYPLQIVRRICNVPSCPAETKFLQHILRYGRAL